MWLVVGGWGYTSVHARIIPHAHYQILFEETLYQKASDGTDFVEMLKSKGM